MTRTPSRWSLGSASGVAALLRADGQHPVVAYPHGTHSWSFVTAMPPSAESFLEVGRAP